MKKEYDLSKVTYTSILKKTGALLSADRSLFCSLSHHISCFTNTTPQRDVGKLVSWLISYLASCRIVLNYTYSMPRKSFYCPPMKPRSIPIRLGSCIISAMLGIWPFSIDSRAFWAPGEDISRLIDSGFDMKLWAIFIS